MPSRNRRVDAIEHQLGDIDRRLDRIYTALVIRDPGTPMSADAYEGLRKQVVASSAERVAHVAQLAELDVAIKRGASSETLDALVDQWLQQSGVTKVDDPQHDELFESTTKPGEPVIVELPAYVDSLSGRLVRQGRLRPADSALVGDPSTAETGPDLTSPADAAGPS